jgi:hypothetical protein
VIYFFCGYWFDVTPALAAAEEPSTLSDSKRHRREARLAPLNLIVWAKTNGGMGSLYRSQHELLPLFKKGSALHVNNVELGKRGRWRSNVWTYPSPGRNDGP